MNRSTSTPSADDTLDLAEAARYMKLGYEAMRELFQSGQIPGASLNQQHVVFLRDDLRAYIAQLGRKQAAERRSGIKPSEHAATRRPRHWRPDLDAAERNAVELADSDRARAEREPGTRRRR
jgi:hypothetical protein